MTVLATMVASLSELHQACLALPVLGSAVWQVLATAPESGASGSEPAASGSTPSGPTPSGPAPSGPPPSAQTQKSSEPAAKGFAAALLKTLLLPYAIPDARVPGEPDSKRQSIVKLTEKFLAAGPEQRCLLVLGESGMGKTAYALHTLRRHQERGASKRQPLLSIALSHPDALVSVADVPAEERKKCILVLDGLDEYPATESDPKLRLLRLLAQLGDFQKLIITCKREFFSTGELESLLAPEAKGDDAEPPAAATHERWTALEILPLGDKQIAKYLKQRYPLLQLGRRNAAKKHLLENPQVSGCTLVVAHSEDLLPLKRPAATLSEALDAILAAWLLREKANVEPDVNLGWAKRLALVAYRKSAERRRARVSPDELASLARELGALPAPNPERRPLLALGTDGFMSFVEPLMMEYLFVEAFLEMSTEARRAWSEGQPVVWTARTRQFLRERCQVRGVNLSLLDLSTLDLGGIDLGGRQLEGTLLAGANLAGARLGQANFKGAVLDGAKLTGADLRGAVLENARLRAADLGSADLRDAVLDGADLREANLEGSQLGGASLKSAELDAKALASVVPPGCEWSGGVPLEPRTRMRFSWVPGGCFKMGKDGDPPESSPAHWVRVSSFWLAETPVTNRQYGIFMLETGHPEPAYWRDERFADPDQPVVGVSFADAQAFCRWLEQTSGLSVSLPSEAEWEYGARGNDGRSYPWGEAVPDASRARFGEDAMSGAPAKVGSYPPGRGPHGTLDQAGNVWEWCLDGWDGMAYLKRSGETPLDPVITNGQVGVQLVRGGSWFFPSEDLNATVRGKSEASQTADDVGFRVALHASPAGSAPAINISVEL